MLSVHYRFAGRLRPSQPRKPVPGTTNGIPCSFKLNLGQLPLGRISRYDFHFELSCHFQLLLARSTSRRSNKNGKYERHGHQSRDQIECLDVVSIDLPQISEQVRSERGGEGPRQHHQAENGSHVPRTKIIGRERRSNSVRSAIAHHDNESNNSQYRKGRNAVVSPEENRLDQVHREKCGLTRRQIGYPGPKNAADSIPNTDHADEAGSCRRTRLAHLLKYGRRL